MEIFMYITAVLVIYDLFIVGLDIYLNFISQERFNVKMDELVLWVITSLLPFVNVLTALAATITIFETLSRLKLEFVKDGYGKMKIVITR